MEYLPVVIDAEYVTDYKIKVTFDNGEKRIADCFKWLNGEVFEPLKDKVYFKNFFVDGWSISWPNGADISPEALYEESQPGSGLNLLLCMNISSKFDFIN